jgi:hypothetical protein
MISLEVNGKRYEVDVQPDMDVAWHSAVPVRFMSMGKPFVPV